MRNGFFCFRMRSRSGGGDVAADRDEEMELRVGTSEEQLTFENTERLVHLLDLLHPPDLLLHPQDLLQPLRPPPTPSDLLHLLDLLHFSDLLLHPPDFLHRPRTSSTSRSSSTPPASSTHLDPSSTSQTSSTPWTSLDFLHLSKKNHNSR